jgi:SHS2 domain-containing protein
MAYKEIDHSADVAIHVSGSDLEDLFRQAALGMMQLMAPAAHFKGPVITHMVTLTGNDSEELLVEWLSELAYLAESKSMAVNHYSFERMTRHNLKAQLKGHVIDGIQRHIKAVTYHNLSIVETRDGVEVTIVFDV